MKAHTDFNDLATRSSLGYQADFKAIVRAWRPELAD